VVDTVLFEGVKAEDLTPTLTIIIESVNGMSSRVINETDYMRIYTADLEEKARVAQTAWSAAEDEAALAKARSDAAAAEAAEAKKRSDDLKTAEDLAKAKAWRDKTTANSKRGVFNLSAYLQFTRSDSFDSDTRPGHHPSHGSDAETGFGTGFGLGLEIGSYLSFLPFTSVGIEVKGGFFNSRFLDTDFEKEDFNGWYANASPVAGVVLPLTSQFKLFADWLFEIGLFGNGLKGLISNYVTYGFDVGLSLWSLKVKYRGVWYDRGYVNAVVLGL
jgi:hypothetical protein